MSAERCEHEWDESLEPREYCKKCGADSLDERMNFLVRKVRELEAHLAASRAAEGRMRGWLAKYGRHRATCPYSMQADALCECGYLDALAPPSPPARDGRPGDGEKEGA
jgi:hypothetical protein